MKTYIVLAIIGLALLYISGCNQAPRADRLQEALDRIDVLEAKLDEVYVPGWGEVMRGSTQVHHSNLWFAGLAGNWELAEHMVEELAEGFEKLEKLYPDDERTTALSMIYPPMNSLRDAIAKQDKEAFQDGYLTLSNSCNACHTATDNEIYLIQVPDSPGFTNQNFDPQD